ncbi:MAG TPA: hypothetical protein VFW00_11020 [Rhodocyclaceae bacterium]|nr:hypothetical protein [Rhodocyclaceae bacterium]
MAYAQQPLTPAQAAFLKAETRKADNHFVQRVSVIVGVKEGVVQSAMPEKGRIADPVARLIAGLERSMGQPLAEDRKVQIRAADEERLNAIKAAEVAAHKK